MVPPLTSAVVVLRGDASLGALPHVVSYVSQCLDCSVEIPLARACASGSARLLRRIWDASEELAASSGDDPQPELQRWSLLRFLRLDCHYRRDQFSRGVVEAVRHGDLDMVRWLLDRFSGCVVPVQAVEAAAAAGNQRILQLFFDTEFSVQDVQEGVATNVEGNRVQWGDGDMAAAVENKHVDVARWHFEHKGVAERDWGRFIAGVVRGGDLEMLQWVLDRGYADRRLAPPTIDDAAWGGHMDMLQWLYDHGHVHHASFALEYAACNGHLDIVEWLVRYLPVGNASRALDAAARENHLDVVRWLLEHNLGRGAKSGMHQAAIRGYLDVAKYLYEQGFHGLASVSCGTMLRAAGRGLIDVVKWLNDEFGSDPQAHLYRDQKEGRLCTR
ncbi:unnamed protein product [Phytophthora lilii]|uniref:Unnamed protein product n=1 Tax=Phytophthora lilii TaxID=2077276 RepID=A0A9W6XER3_9STRA|nr:unnamed protein product [Phytophthora lilii]